MWMNRSTQRYWPTSYVPFVLSCVSMVAQRAGAGRTLVVGAQYEGSAATGVDCD